MTGEKLLLVVAGKNATDSDRSQAGGDRLILTLGWKGAARVSAKKEMSWTDILVHRQSRGTLYPIIGSTKNVHWSGQN